MKTRGMGSVYQRNEIWWVRRSSYLCSQLPAVTAQIRGMRLLKSAVARL